MYARQLSGYAASNRAIRIMSEDELNSCVYNVPVFKQSTDNSCWIYAEISIYAYNKNYMDWNNTDADNLASYFLKEDDPTGNPMGGSAFYNTYEELKSGLEKNGPIIAKLNKNGGHSVVVVGVYTNEKNIGYVLYNNLDGTQKSESFNEFKKMGLNDDKSVEYKIPNMKDLRNKYEPFDADKERKK